MPLPRIAAPLKADHRTMSFLEIGGATCRMKPFMAAESTSRQSRKRVWILVACLLIASAVPIVYTIRSGHAAPPPTPAPKSEQPRNGVSCLGRIEPERGVTHIAAPYLFGRPPAVELVHVAEGSHVRRGALLATLAGRRQLEAALAESQGRVAVARRRLEQVKAGAKTADLSAQTAEIARLEANLHNLQSELRRYETLRRTDDVTESEVESRRTAVLVAERALDQARYRLAALREVPASDIGLVEAQVDAALLEEQRARREYELSQVYAPIDGQILKVHAHAGEEIGAKGLLDMAGLDRMYVVAEVYETDIGRVRPGQRATISGDLLSHPQDGTVERIGKHVLAASVPPGNPASFSDNRVVEVRIRLDSSEAVAGLIDGKVSVVIQP